jgi:hypothetical protein
MSGFLASRHREPEWMDRDDVDPRQLRRSLAFIRRINTLLGYTRATIFHLEQLSRRWRAGERIEIIDLATGSADVPRAILRWAHGRFDVRIVGIDRHAATIAAAGEGIDDTRRLSLVQADALNVPFPDASFDYALTSMFLHHLSDDEAVGVLTEMGRLARRGVIAADLLRHRRAYAWVRALTLFANPIVRHDAAVSVAQAFTRDEVLVLRERAGLGYARYHRHFGHRFVLAGEKG